MGKQTFGVDVCSRTLRKAKADGADERMQPSATNVDPKTTRTRKQMPVWLASQTGNNATTPEKLSFSTETTNGSLFRMRVPALNRVCNSLLIRAGRSLHHERPVTPFSTPATWSSADLSIIKGIAKEPSCLTPCSCTRLLPRNAGFKKGRESQVKLTTEPQ